MCEPTTLAMAATAMTAVTQVYSGYTAKQQGKYEQQVARNNQALEREAAADASSRNSRDQMRKWNEVAQTRAMQIAAMAANGFDTGSGTAADLAGDTLALGYQDVATIADNGQREVRGHLINASNYDAQGRAARAKGNNAFIGSLMSAGGTVLSGASSIMNMKPVSTGAGAGAQNLTAFKPAAVTPLRQNPFGGMTFG